MSVRQRRSPAEGEFLFEIDEQPLEECLTALGGVPLLVRTLRSLDVPGNVRRHIAIKKRRRGFDEATYVESFVVLQAVGGDCPDDFETLREDAGLGEMLGHELPSPEAARKFLYQFHDEQKVVEAQQQLPLGRVSAIPAEGEALRGLAEVNQELVRELGPAQVGRRSPPLIWTPRSSQAASVRRSRPIKAAAAISLCWRCGRSSTWRLPTSFATATCRRCKIR